MALPRAHPRTLADELRRPLRGRPAARCNGNDVEVHCASAVPARIAGVHGRVTRTEAGAFELVVDRFELAESPAEDAFEQPGWESIRMME